MIKVKQLENFIDQFGKKLESFWFAFLIIFLILVGHQLSAISADPDLFARIAVGRLFENVGTILKVDPFAFTVKKALWIDHEWLSGVVFYQISQLGGDWGIYLAKLFFMGLTLFFVLQAERLFSNKCYPIFTLVLMLACGYIWASNIRSQVFTYLFLPIFIICFEKLRTGRKLPLLVMPLIMLIWCNAHGGFVVGLGLLFLYTLVFLIVSYKHPTQSKSRKLFLLACVLTLLATFVTPYEIKDYWGYVIEAVTMTRPSISEWASVKIFSSEAVFPLIVAIILVSGFIRLHQKRELPFIQVALLLVAFYQGIRHDRLTAIFYILSAIYGGVAILECERLFKESFLSIFLKLRRATLMVVLLATILVSGQVGNFIINSGSFSLNTDKFPVNALNWLKSNRSGGNLLVDFNRGSYALWVLYPDFLISLDGRYEEVYPESTNILVSQAITPSSENHIEALNTVNPDFVLLQSKDFLFERLEIDWPNFQPIYCDNQDCLLERGIKKQKIASLKDVSTSNNMWTPTW